MVYVRRKGHCYMWRCERTAADDYRAFLLVLAFVRLSSPWRALIARVSWRAFAMDAFGLLMTRAVRVPRVPPIGALHFLFASASAALRPAMVTSWGPPRFFCRAGAAFFLRCTLCLSVLRLGSALLRFGGAVSPFPEAKMSMDMFGFAVVVYDPHAFIFQREI